MIRFAAFFLLALLLCAAPASAGTPAARQALETSITRILDSIRNPDYVNPTKRAPLRQQIEDEVLHIFDFQEFSARTVGGPWRTFSDAEKKRFSDAFAELLLITYLSKIDGYNGEQVIYTGEKFSSKGDRAEIGTIVKLKDNTRVPVAYRMMPKNGTWCVYDVLIEGVSLVKNYRTQFQDILVRRNAEELISRVQSKGAELKKQSR